MRSHYCGQLNESLEGQEITLCGWVHRRRDHGGVIFLDIRDRDGLAQVVFDPDRAETFAKADRVRSEYVVKITGKVRLRPEGARNANMASGAIEVLGYQLEVLNEAEDLGTDLIELVVQVARLRDARERGIDRLQ